MGRVIVRPIAENLGDAIAMRYLGPGPNAPPLKNNGITGDARRASKALGKKRFEMKVDDMVKPIRGMTGRWAGTRRNRRIPGSPRLRISPISR